MKLRSIFLFFAIIGLWGYSEAQETNAVEHVVNSKRIIHFSGYDWEVGNGDLKQGPGPNYFSDSKENVWVDDSGRLHLRITKRDNHWYCAKVTLLNSYGYGTYVFHVASIVDKFDKNVVGGLFTYENDTSEIDIEFSKWNKEKNEDSQFVIQPGSIPENKCRYFLNQTEAASTHWFNWQKDSISFASYYGDVAVNNSENSLIRRWVYKGDDIPVAGGERAKINLWLFRGKPPTEQLNNEMIISGFEIQK